MATIMSGDNNAVRQMMEVADLWAVPLKDLNKAIDSAMATATLGQNDILRAINSAEELSRVASSVNDFARNNLSDYITKTFANLTAFQQAHPFDNTIQSISDAVGSIPATNDMWSIDEQLTTIWAQFDDPLRHLSTLKGIGDAALLSGSHNGHPITQIDITGTFNTTLPGLEASQEQTLDDDRNLLETQTNIVAVHSAKLLHMLQREPQLMHELSPRQFEELVVEILIKRDYQNVVLTPPARDGGRDVLATYDLDGMPVFMAFECKKKKPGKKVGVNIIRALLGAINQRHTPATMGVLVTTSTFTKGARDLIHQEHSLGGKDYDGVVQWMGICEKN
ncbi:MAG: restriction endonuclease [Deinococcota bacterium]